VLVGARDAVSKARQHPMMRALRPDKLTIAGLEATLSVYRDGRAREAIPAVAMLTADPGELRARATAARNAIGELDSWVAVELVACESAVGGGAMPDAEMPSWGLSLRAREPDRPGCSATAIERKLRAAPIPIVGRIVEDAVILDVRTVAEDELDALVAAVRAL